MHIRKTILLAIFSFITLCVSIGVFIFFFQAIENKNIHTQAVLSTLENKIAEKNNTSILLRKIKKVNEVKQDIENHFVDTSHINIFVDSLEKLGTSANTSLKVTDVALSESDPNIVTVKVSIQGSFAHVSQAIALLENIEYHVHVKEIYLSKQITAPVVDAKGKVTTPGFTSWEAKVSFVVLTS
jgi:hypothetical protein